MDWSNLKENKCPNCSKDISTTYSLITKMFECNCGFKITAEKFNKIVTSKVMSEIENEVEQKL